MYFSITPEASIDAYVNLKCSPASYFGFFGANALDASRFIFGVSVPQAVFHKGAITLDALHGASGSLEGFIQQLTMLENSIYVRAISASDPWSGRSRWSYLPFQAATSTYAC